MQSTNNFLQKQIAWSAFWVALSFIFSYFLCFQSGTENAITFLSCYTIEKLLSFDNLFMFYVIFGTFCLDESEQRRALSFGIWGAFILRGIFIFGGSFLISMFSWLIYPLGVFLIYSGGKLLFQSEEDNDNNIIHFVRRNFHNFSLFILSIISIEIADIIFAFDSVPASFGITSNPWLIFSSNVLALLGLRSLYFVMLEAIKRFCYLSKSIGVILSFIGVKMIYEWNIPIYATFGFIILTMTIGMLASINKGDSNV